MGRKPLDTSDETIRLTFRLTKRQTDGIDAKRGKVSRSAYVRALIDSALNDGQPVIAYRTAAEVIENTPARKIKVEPIQKVECDHDWVRAGNIFDRCTKCEDTRRR